MAGVFDNPKSNNLDVERDGDNEDSLRVEPKGTFCAAAAAGLLLGTQKNEREDMNNGIEPFVGQSEEGERKSSVRVGTTAPQLSSETCKVRPLPGQTRAVGVQTEPEIMGARCTAASAMAGQAQQMTDNQAVVATSTMSLECFTDHARLEERSTAPDIWCRSLGTEFGAQSVTGPRDAIGDKRPKAWQSNEEEDPASSTRLQKATVEEGRAPASGNGSENLVGSSSKIAPSAGHREDRTDNPPTVPADGWNPLSLGFADEIRSTALPENGAITMRQQEMLDTTGRGGGNLATGECSSSGVVDPSLVRRSKVNEVTRELQRLLREDALQDNGEYNAGIQASPS